MNVYIASSWRNLLQPGIVVALRKLGFTVYDYRNPHGDDNGFGWKQIALDWGMWSPRQWRDALQHPIAVAGYKNDFDAMLAADCCVLVLPCGRSAHLEAGFMAGQGKPVYTLALEKQEPELMSLLLGPASNICVTMDELFDALGVNT